MEVIEKRVRLLAEDWEMLAMVEGMTGLTTSKAIRACVRGSYPSIAARFEAEERRIQETNAMFQGVA